MKSIQFLEMINHVSPLIKIDSFQAKLGRDEDVSVIQLQTDNKAVAKDLVSFIESGHKEVLDADYSPAKNDQKKYNVFIELERNDNLPKYIMEMIRDIEKITGMMSWEFTFYKNDTAYKLSEENLKNQVPTTEQQYTFLTDDSVDEDIQTLFKESTVSVQRQGKKLILDKTVIKHNFIIESINVPSEEINGVYKIDQNSTSQAEYLDSWLGGGWSVIKIDDIFKIAKNNTNIMLRAEDL